MQASDQRNDRPNQPKRTTTPFNRQKIVPRIYEVVVACRDEEDQRVVFERMRSEGYHCRVLTL